MQSISHQIKEFQLISCNYVLFLRNSQQDSRKLMKYQNYDCRKITGIRMMFDLLQKMNCLCLNTDFVKKSNFKISISFVHTVHAWQVSEHGTLLYIPLLFCDLPNNKFLRNYFAFCWLCISFQNFCQNRLILNFHQLKIKEIGEIRTLETVEENYIYF